MRSVNEVAMTLVEFEERTQAANVVGIGELSAGLSEIY